jgi:hypothetical protein
MLITRCERALSTLGKQYIDKILEMEDNPMELTQIIDDAFQAAQSGDALRLKDLLESHPHLANNVTASYFISSSYQVSVPSGHTYTIYAFPILNQYSYDVWYAPDFGNDFQAGTDWSNEPTGEVYLM